LKNQGARYNAHFFSMFYHLELAHLLPANWEVVFFACVQQIIEESSVCLVDLDVVLHLVLWTLSDFSCNEEQFHKALMIGLN
jgi:hypothetical protein